MTMKRTTYGVDLGDASYTHGEIAEMAIVSGLDEFFSALGYGLRPKRRKK